MKTVGDKLEKFAVTGVKPGQPEDAFYTITDESFEGKWKVIVYYPKDFTFVCPTEIVAYDKLAQDFADRDAILLTGSTDNEFCKVAWQNAHPDLKNIRHNQFADTARHQPGEERGLFLESLQPFIKRRRTAGGCFEFVGAGHGEANIGGSAPK